MLLYLLFTVAAFGAECETSTCLTCKNMTGCNWYGFDCLNTTGTLVTNLKPEATATCPMCQAGSCGECLAQSGCSWFTSKVGSKCEKSDYTSTVDVYTAVTVCPTCQNNLDCTTCYANATQGCSWFALPGGTAGKCREAAPSFAYSKVGSDKCGAALCSGIQSCTTCQNSTYGANSSACVWYNSASPKFYNSKCDDRDANFAQQALYTANSGVCPACAGTSCVDCKAEAGCKWAAVSTMGFGTAFGECLRDSAETPTGKSVVATCPATCKKYSCSSCLSNPACSWFADSKLGSVESDECDLSGDKHYSQTPVTDASVCKPCAATRCYDCNVLPNCGWYVEKVLGVTVKQGCFAKNDPSISDRTLRDNTNKDCEGAPNSSAHLAASMGLVLIMAMFA